MDFLSELWKLIMVFLFASMMTAAHGTVICIIPAILIPSPARWYICLIIYLVVFFFHFSMMIKAKYDDES